MDESKNTKMLINKSGGNASAGAMTSRVTIPGRWIKEMGITAEAKDIRLSFDGKKIIIEKI